MSWWSVNLVDWTIDQLKRFTYKPGWKMEIRDPLGEYDDPTLLVQFRAEDTYNPGRTIPIVSRDSIPFYVVKNQDPERFAVWLQEVLFKIERHESQEWLKRDGVIHKDPHKERA